MAVMDNEPSSSTDGSSEAPSGVLPFEGGVTSARGFVASGVNSGVKKKNLDLALIVSERPAAAAGTFTLNRVQAACVRWCRDVVKRDSARAIVVNSGNANACTGERGERDNALLAQAAAAALGVEAEEVFIASTGVIGVPLAMDKLTRGIASAAQQLTAAGGVDAAAAIMTTDTAPKTAAARVELAGGVVTVGGIAKGSGMIEPNMATTLAFVTTDAQVAPDVLQGVLSSATDRSFNCITVDGDTSTNDSLLLMANGASGVVVDSARDLEAFSRAVDFVCLDLAKKVVLDGEGATKLVRIEVTTATTEADAKRVAKTVANSPLVKTALHGGEPNWGRVLMAVGRAGAEIDESRIGVWFGEVKVVESGLGLLSDLGPLAAEMAKSRVDIRIDLGLGDGAVTVWTCDLSAEYVRINGSYIS